MAKMGLIYAISMVNWIFGNHLFNRCYSFLFFTDFKLLMFHNNIVKIFRNFEQVKLVEKPASKLPTLSIYA